MLQRHVFQQQVMQVHYIAIGKPNFNEQLEPDRLNLFRNGVTCVS